MGGPAIGVHDFMVHQIEAGDFRSYTRNFPEGVYEVYLRQAVLGMDQAEAVLETVSRFIFKQSPEPPKTFPLSPYSRSSRPRAAS